MYFQSNLVNGDEEYIKGKLFTTKLHYKAKYKQSSNMFNHLSLSSIFLFVPEMLYNYEW